MVTASLPGTVKNFGIIAGGLITRYDKALEKRGQSNIYRLGLLLEALHKAEDKVRQYANDDSPEALNAFKAALSKSFIVSDMPPIKAVIKQIDAFLQTGKPPKYVMASRVADRFLMLRKER